MTGVGVQSSRPTPPQGSAGLCVDLTKQWSRSHVSYGESVESRTQSDQPTFDILDVRLVCLPNLQGHVSMTPVIREQEHVQKPCGGGSLEALFPREHLGVVRAESTNPRFGLYRTSRDPPCEARSPIHAVKRCVSFYGCVLIEACVRESLAVNARHIYRETPVSNAYGSHGKGSLIMFLGVRVGGGCLAKIRDGIRAPHGLLTGGPRS